MIKNSLGSLLIQTQILGLNKSKEKTIYKLFDQFNFNGPHLRQIMHILGIIYACATRAKNTFVYRPNNNNLFSIANTSPCHVTSYLFIKSSE